MIAERPDIGECRCAPDSPDRCSWDSWHRRWRGPCVAEPTTIELLECSDPTCHATELGVGQHYHRADT